MKSKIIEDILENKSSQRLRESFFIKNHNSVYLDIINFCVKISDLPFKQKVWHYVNNENDYFKCKTCGINTTKFYMNWKDGYRPFCSTKCSANNSETAKKRKETNIEIYGKEFPMQNDEVKLKTEQTNIEIYGYKSSFQNKDVQEKWKKTIKERYDVEHISKSKKLIEKKADNLEKKTGYRCLLSSTDFRNDIKTKNLEKHGCEYVQQTKDYQLNFKQNLKDKIGVENAMFSDIFKQKQKDTNIKKIKDKYSRFFENSEYELVDFKDSNFFIKHKTCERIFEAYTGLVNDRLRYNICLCTECYPISQNNSISELEIIDYINSLGVETTKDRSILEGKELDIYIPSHNLAIEYNGLYWHSELYKDNTYHLNKSLMCQEKGIFLMHIWEDEWKFKREIVKSIISNRLGKIDNKIFARKCEIKEVKDSKLVRKFLDDNHIQGYSQSSVKLGLYYENELVSLMTFGYRHTNSMKEFELIRFCNKLNTNVIGASSRLFKHFLNNYSEDTILSYSDFRLFDGNMYESLGFEKIHLSKPDYFWCKDMKRYHRFTFNKKKLVKEGFDASKTGDEIMRERGYYKIFSCGQVRWVYKK